MRQQLRGQVVVHDRRSLRRGPPRDTWKRWRSCALEPHARSVSQGPQRPQSEAPKPCGRSLPIPRTVESVTAFLAPAGARPVASMKWASATSRDARTGRPRARRRALRKPCRVGDPDLISIVRLRGRGTLRVANERFARGRGTLMARRHRAASGPRRQPPPIRCLRDHPRPARARDRRGADPRRAERGAARGGAPRRGAAADHRRGRDRQDDRADAPHRAPHRDEARAARGDPRAHLHREGRRRDGRAGGPADPVRLRRDGDLDVPRVRRPRAARVGARGRARPPVPGALAAGAGDLPARAAVPAAARALPPARRPDPPPRRARDAREPRQGRGRLAGAVPRLGRGTARRGGGRRGAGRGASRTSSSPPSTRRTSGCSPRPGSWTSATRSTARSRCCASGRPYSHGCARATATSLVDEFQDTNHAQLEMLKLLAGEAGNLTVVGDDDQAIYRWRGAAAANLLAFRRLHPGAREVVLVENYRSTQVILDAAARLVGYNNPHRLEAIAGIDKRLRSSRAGRPARPPRALRHRLGRGRRRRGDDRGAAAGRARGRATSRSSCAATPTPIPSCARSTCGACRTASAAAAGSTRARRCGCSSRSCGCSRTPTTRCRSSTSPRPRCTGPRDGPPAPQPLRPPQDTAAARAAARAARQRGAGLGLGAAREAAARLVADLERAVAEVPRRRTGEVLYGFLQWSGLLGRSRRRPRPRPRRRSRTSRASSTW